MLTEPLLPEEDEEDRLFLEAFAKGFTGEIVPHPFGTALFEEETDTDLWDTTDWWTGQEKPTITDANTTTRSEKEQAEETFEQSSGTSAGAFQAAEAATMGSKETQRWFQQSNGRIPLDKMVQVAPGHYLREDAGAGLKAMQRAARKDGITIAYTDTYRDYAGQVAAKAAKGAYAATPGTSNHGWGMAIDFNVNDPKVLAWMRENAAKFGWKNPAWAHDGEGIEEPWHWEYSGGGSYKPKTHKRKKDKRLVPAERKLHQLAAHELDESPVPLSAKGSFMNSILALADDFDEDVVVARRNGEDPEPVIQKKALKEVPKDLRQYFLAAAKRTGLPLKVLVTVAQHESGFRTDAISSAGAVGVMQLMPSHWQGNFDPKDPKKNIAYGANYLAALIDQYGLRRGLASYNGGPNNWQAGLGYADSIINDMRGN